MISVILKKKTLIIQILIFNSCSEIPKGSVKFVNSQNRKQKIGESKILIFFMINGTMFKIKIINGHQCKPNIFLH